MREARAALAVLVVFVVPLCAQTPAPPTGYNYDEAKVAAYKLIDPLILPNGATIRSASAWKQARSVWLALFEKNVFGRVPDAAVRLRIRPQVIEQDQPSLGGLGLRTQVDIPLTSGQTGPVMHLLLYLPAHASRRSPVVLGLNFAGNASVLDDPAIRATDIWVPGEKRGDPSRRAPFDAARRGAQLQQWQVRMLLEHGYGFATAYYGDIEPDARATDIGAGVRAAYRAEGNSSDWGALSAWAWGLSRALDYLLALPRVDPQEVVVTGHSRLGKAADWAAATDQRFAALLSTESGKGGQSLYRRNFGETIAHLEHSFPYWFAPKYGEWAGRDAEIPVDGNILLALIAPRPLYVASAHDDLFSDPEGEFESAADAGRVYSLYGRQGLGVASQPPLDSPVMHDIAYHVRSGKHDVTAFDWEQYLVFLDREFGSPLKSAAHRKRGSQP